MDEVPKTASSTGGELPSGPLIGPCHLLHTTPGADDTWMSWAPQLLILSGRSSPFPPSFCITFHCPPPLPLSLAVPLGSSLLPFCLSSGPPSGQANPLWPSSLAGRLAAIQNILGRVVARAGNPSRGRCPLPLLPRILGPILCLFPPADAPPQAAGLTLLSRHPSDPTS